jgi:hypothetical protein
MVGGELKGNEELDEPIQQKIIFFFFHALSRLTCSGIDAVISSWGVQYIFYLKVCS